MVLAYAIWLLYSPVLGCAALSSLNSRHKLCVWYEMGERFWQRRFDEIVLFAKPSFVVEISFLVDVGFMVDVGFAVAVYLVIARVICTRHIDRNLDRRCFGILVVVVFRDSCEVGED